MKPILQALLLFLCTIAINSSTAHPKKNNSPYLDNGELHQKITALEKSIHAATYFVIAAQTDLSVNTNSSAIINAYNDMRGISATTPIYFVLHNNGGITSKDMDWYLQKVFRLPVHTDSNLHMIENEALYHLLHFGGATAKNYYIYNTLLAYKESGKYELIGDAALPAHKYELTEKKSVQLLNDTIRLSYMDYFKPMSENEMLFMTDIQNKVVVFDLNTGNMTKVYNPGKTGVDYYCEFIAKTQAECDTARKHNDFLEDLNRKNYYIFNMEFDENHVYLSAGIQVMVRLKKKLEFNNDEGAKAAYVYDTGQIFGYGFNIMAVLDRNLQLQYHYIIPEDILPDEDDLLCTECAFVFTDSNQLISSVIPDKQTTPLLAALEIKGKELKLKKYLPPIATKHFIKLRDETIFHYFCNFNGVSLMITDMDRGIYDIRYANPVNSLLGDGTPLIKEHVPKYSEESEDIRLNFQPAGMSTDGKCLYILYNFKDYYLLEVKNKKYQTIDVINLAAIKGIEQIPPISSSENISLYKNKLYIKYIQGDSYYMTVYDINKVTERKQ